MSALPEEEKVPRKGRTDSRFPVRKRVAVVIASLQSIAGIRNDVAGCRNKAGQTPETSRKEINRIPCARK
jgi:hypothetical protein